MPAFRLGDVINTLRKYHGPFGKKMILILSAGLHGADEQDLVQPSVQR